MTSPRDPDAREALAQRVAARINGILNYSGELRFDLSIAELKTIEAALRRQTAAPGGEPDVCAICGKQFKYDDDVIATKTIVHLACAKAALPSATPPSDDRAKVVEDAVKALTGFFDAPAPAGQEE